MSNTSAKFKHLAVERARVMGTYYGIEFSGVVVKSQRLSRAPDYPEEIMIELDRPIRVFGVDNTCILISSGEVDDGIMTVNQASFMPVLR